MQCTLGVPLRCPPITMSLPRKAVRKVLAKAPKAASSVFADGVFS